MIDSNAPLLVFGGPYSNLHATQAIRAEAERRGIAPTNVICTGDVVAYAASPEATTNAIREWGVHVIAGNCEEQLAEGAGDCGCGFEEGSACDRLSRGWYPYALSHTSGDSRRWMSRLPGRLDFVFANRRFCVLHGGATRNNRFLFGSDDRALEHEFGAARDIKACDVVLAGHAGIPFVRELELGWWINSGVIGMPANDGTPDGWFTIIDYRLGNLAVTLHRLSYDHIAAAGDMRRAGHANGYARTMVTGIWPSHDVLPNTERVATGLPLKEATYNLRPASLRRVTVA